MRESTYARLHWPAASCRSQQIVSIEKADNENALEVERDMGFTLRRAADDAGEIVASKAIPQD